MGPKAALLLLTLLLWGNAAWAQSNDSDAKPAAPLDRSHVLRVFDPLEFWIQEHRVADRDDEATPLPELRSVVATGVSAARVELRWLGALVGEGVAESSDPDGRTDVMALSKAAAERAIQDLAAELGKEVQQLEDTGSVGGLLPRDRTLARVLPQVTLGLEVAGSPTPLTIPDDAPQVRVFSLLAPSVDGLLLVNPGGDQAATLWPAEAAALNLQPMSQFTGLLKRAGLPTRPAWRIGRKGHGQLSTFPVIHRARGRLGVEPRFLVRGHPIAPGDHATTADMEKLMRNLSTHLGARVRDNGTIAGRYLPSSDQYDPIDAAAQDAGIVVFALARSVAVRQRLVIIEPGNESELQARIVMRPLLQAIANSKQAQALAPAGLALMAADTLPTVLDQAAQRAVLSQQFRVLVDLHLPEGGKPAVGTATLAIAGAAAAMHASRTGDRDWRALATRLIDDLDKARPDPDPAWLHWRMLAQHHSPGRLPRQPDVNVPLLRLGWPQLSAALGTAEATQVSRVPKVGPNDVRGGFNLRSLHDGPVPDAPLPDWRSAGIIYAQAIMLRQPAKVGGDAANPLDRLLSAALGVRFLDQLTVHEGSAWFMRSPSAALHGLRAAPWDNRVSPAATAMALLAVTEMRLAVEP